MVWYDTSMIKNIPDLSHLGTLRDFLTSIAEHINDLEKTVEQSKQPKQTEDLSLQDVCRELNRSYSTVYRLVKRKQIPVNRANRDYRVTRKDLEDFRKRCTF